MQNSLQNLAGIVRTDYYRSGAVRHCTLDAKNEVSTNCGKLIPRFGEMTVRRKNTSSLSFYENGAVKRVALEQQMPVKTPLGEISAELVTFYKSGALKRFFPLDGQINGYWSEQDEEGLLEALELKLPIGGLKAKIIGCCFYENGAVKSLTLWPTQTVHVNTDFGNVSVRSGLSFFENGALKSLEPAQPTAVPTPIGLLKAYDAAAVGINADTNSLEFDESGSVCALTVPGTIFKATRSDGRAETVGPVMAVSPLDDESMIEIPVRVCFANGSVILSVNGQPNEYDLKSTQFIIEPKKQLPAKCSGGNCAACGMCSISQESAVQ